MAAVPGEELILTLGAAPAYLAAVRAFVGETWRSLGFDDEATEDAKLAASEVFTELLARGGNGEATVTISVEVGMVATRIQVHGIDAPISHSVAGGEQRRSLIDALMPDVREDLDGSAASITFTIARPT